MGCDMAPEGVRAHATDADCPWTLETMHQTAMGMAVEVPDGGGALSSYAVCALGAQERACVNKMGFHWMGLSQLGTK
jgi:hypothetical protein